VPQPESALVFLGDLDEIADGGEFDGGWIPPLDEMQHQRQCGQRQSGKDPGREKADHASPAGRATTRRSAWPNGVSVVT